MFYYDAFQKKYYICPVGSQSKIGNGRQEESVLYKKGTRIYYLSSSNTDTCYIIVTKQLYKYLSFQLVDKWDTTQRINKNQHQKTSMPMMHKSFTFQCPFIMLKFSFKLVLLRFLFLPFCYILRKYVSLN